MDIGVTSARDRHPAGAGKGLPTARASWFLLIVSSLLIGGGACSRAMAEDGADSGAAPTTLQEFVARKKRDEPVSKELEAEAQRAYETILSGKTTPVTLGHFLIALRAATWLGDSEAVLGAAKVWWLRDSLCRDWAQTSIFVLCFEWVGGMSAPEWSSLLEACDRGGREARAMVWARQLRSALVQSPGPKPDDMKRYALHLRALAEYRAFPPDVQAVLEAPLLDVVFNRPIAVKDVGGLFGPRLPARDLFRGMAAIALGVFDARPGLAVQCLARLEKGRTAWRAEEYLLAFNLCGDVLVRARSEDIVRRLVGLFDTSAEEARVLICAVLGRMGEPLGANALRDLLRRHADLEIAPYIRISLAIALDEPMSDEDLEWFKEWDRSRWGEK